MLIQTPHLKASEIFLSPKATTIYEETLGRIFSKEFFTKDWDSLFVKPDQLKIGTVEKGMRKITDPTIVITTHSNNMVYLLASETEPIYLPGELYKDDGGYLFAFRPSPLIMPEYLYYMCQNELWGKFTSQFLPINNDGFCTDWSRVGYIWEGGMETPHTVISSGSIELPNLKEQRERVEAAKEQDANIKKALLSKFDVKHLVSRYLFGVRKENIINYKGLGLIAKVYQLAAKDKANPKVIEILNQYVFQEGILSEKELMFLSLHINEVFNEVLDFGDIKIVPSPGFIQPQEVTDFVCKMAEFPENITVYNPFAGADSYALALPNKVIGEELDPLTWALGQIRLFANNALGRVDISMADSFDRMEDEKKYTAIISSPVYLREKGHQIEDIVRLLYGKLEKGGKLACLVPANFLRGNGKDLLSFRKMLIEHKAVAGVFMLPSNIFTGSSIPQAVVLITKGLQNTEIIFADASGYTKYEKSAYRATTFDKNTFLEDYSEDLANHYECEDEVTEETIAYPIDYSDLIGSDLTPGLYLIPKPNDGIRLSDLAEEIPEIEGKDKKAEYFITGSSIPVAMHRKPYCPENIKDGNISTSKSHVRVPANAVIVALVSGKIRTVYTGDFAGVVAFPSGFIKILKPKDGQSAKYLAAVISTKEVADQIIAQTSGLTIPRLNRVNLDQIIIPSHKTIEEQEKLISEVLSSEMSDLESELQITLDTHKREVRSTRHAMIQTLSALSSNWEQLKLFAELKKEGLALSDTIGRVNPISVKDLMESIGYAVSTLQRQVEALRLEKSDWGKESAINPFKFINSYISTHSNPEIRMVNIGPDNIVDFAYFDEKTGETIQIHDEDGDIFYAPERLVERIFNNIVANAMAHGFSDERLNKEIRFDWQSEEGNIIITIANNGLPLKNGVSGKDVLMSGFTTALNENSKDGTLHSGQGGYEIKSLMEGLGSVEVISRPDEEFPVIYKLTFEKTNFEMINLFED